MTQNQPHDGQSAGLPTSCKQVFEQIPGRLNRQRAQGIKAIYQFDVSGPGGGQWHLTIDNGNCHVTEGGSSSPNIKITMEASEFLDLIAGKSNPQAAFTSGKIKVTGDMSLAAKLGELFGASQPAGQASA